MKYLSLIFLLIMVLPLQAQTDTTQVLTENEVVRTVEEVARDLMEITSELNRGDRLNRITVEYEDFKPELERYMQAGSDQITTSGINRIQDFLLIMERLELRLDAWQEEILILSQALNNDMRKLEVAMKGLDSLALNNDMPGNYRQHATGIYEQVRNTEELLMSRKEGLLDLQIAVSNDYIRVLKRLAMIRNYRDRYWGRLFARDSTKVMYENVQNVHITDTAWRILRFFQVNPWNTLFFILVIGGIYYGLTRIRRKDLEKKFVFLHNTRLASAIMLGFLLFPLLFPPTTTLIYSVMLILAYIPFLTILRNPPFRESYFSYLVFFITYLSLRLSGFYGPMLPAFILKIIYLSAAGIFLAFLLNKRQYRAFNPRWKVAWLLLWVLKFLLILALLAYFTDRKILAKILVESVGDTIALGMVILYIGFWLDTLIDYLKEQPVVKQLNGAESETMWQKWRNFIRFILLGLFLVAFTHYLHINDYIIEGISRALSTPRVIGSLTFTLGGTLLFFLVLFISSKLAEWIKFFTDGKAIYGSVKRTSTIATMIRFGVILAGFLLALFVSGIPLDKLTIILGALSVGLGFGLQNIVNNLVSGIILVFERPVQVGDMVNVKTFTGIVKDIGIRASVIKTFDGAEVIIPNGHLISEEVINWTLSDQHRRVEIVLGVAYGSDVEKVQELLYEIVKDFKGVLKRPAPVVLFQEFGDSSLNFSLRFWVSNIDDWLVIKSEMTTAVYHALNKANIEIPFPQRDLHIKSTSVKDLKKAMETTGRKK